MDINFEISEILNKFELKDKEKKDLSSLFEFTKYLYDNEENLTKTMNLLKKAKDQLLERIQEMFESSLSENEIFSED